MESKRVTVKVTVRGRVQGVSFRAAMHEKAALVGVEGWVSNRSDGSVEAVLQGDEKAVMKVVEWARLGPPRAEVLTLTEEHLEGHPRQTGFKIIA